MGSFCDYFNAKREAGTNKIIITTVFTVIESDTLFHVVDCAAVVAVHILVAVICRVVFVVNCNVFVAVVVLVLFNCSVFLVVDCAVVVAFVAVVAVTV